jgi:hypothetical protein
MTADLGLSDEQKGKVEAIMKEKMEQKKALKEEHRADMDSLHENFKAQLKGILTEEQMTKWEAMKDEHMAKCPECKEGKMCPMCMKKKGEMMGEKMGEMKGEGKGHDHDHK